jgi:hypothetical protein
VPNAVVPAAVAAQAPARAGRADLSFCRLNPQIESDDAGLAPASSF